jgi:hypothetical protein
MLSKKGLGQERIAKLMGVSQPMISKYLKRNIDDVKRAFSEIGIDFNEVVAVADALSSQLIRGDVQSYMALFASYINLVLSRGDLCAMHIRKYGVSPSCNICLSLFSSSVDPIVEEVKEAVGMFLSRPGVAKLIPNVGTNIVAAKPGAQRITDVVGLTGAIVRANHRATAVGQPAYGGSKHTATILLMIMRVDPSKRAGIVIAYLDECIERLKKQGLRVVFTGPHESPQRIYGDIQGELSKLKKGRVDVIADKGGIGLEPVVYIFGSSAGEAVMYALKCID